jgi:hypothetical protein
MYVYFFFFFHCVFPRIQQAPLLVRHLFKLAYYHEQIREDDSAIKYYQQAYDALRAVPTSHTNLPELKAVAYLINFKLIRLFLSNIKLTEASDQFQLHILCWRQHMSALSLSAPSPLTFLHWVWMIQQYRTMAECLEATPLPSSVGFKNKLLHPSYYYHAAGSCTLRLEECAQVTRHFAIEHRWFDGASASDAPIAAVAAISSPFVGQLCLDFPVLALVYDSVASMGASLGVASPAAGFDWNAYDHCVCGDCSFARLCVF